MVNFKIKDFKVCRTQIFKAPTVQYIKGTHKITDAKVTHEE